MARPFAMGCLWACSVVWDRMIGAQRREAAGCAPSAPGEGRGGPELAIGPGREPDGVYGGPQGPGEPQDGPVEPRRDRRRSGGMIDAQRLDPQGAIWPNAGSGSRRHRSQARPVPEKARYTAIIAQRGLIYGDIRCIYGAWKGESSADQREPRQRKRIYGHEIGG